MPPACALVIESHSFQRRVLIRALTHLRIAQVMSAANTDQAVTCMQVSANIDLVFFDPADDSVDPTELLQVARESGKVRALVLHTELSAELDRAVRRMNSWAGLPLVGVVSKPLRAKDLQRVLASLTPHDLCSAGETNTGVRLIPEQEVHRALALGEFEAWYQPQFDLRDTRLLGAEVLVRWNHPTRGLLLPREILTSVLAYDLLDEMFKQLLAQGMALMATVQEQNIALGLSFNLVASQLLDKHLTDHIIRTWRQHAHPGSVLMLEIPENGLLDLSTTATDNLMRLHQAGCRLAVDDFGQGFSSLRSLTSLPFVQLKLDSLFLQDLNAPCRQTELISSLALAKALQMDLVAEGITDQSTLERLLALGCTSGQGLKLARPMTSPYFLHWLVRQSAPQRH